MFFIKKLLLVIFAIFLFNNGFSQLLVEGELILKEKKNAKDATVKVEKNGNITETIDLKRRGVFSVEMELNNNYSLHFTEENYVTKKIQINTNIPGDKKSKNLNPIYFEVEIFPEVPDNELGGFRFPVGKIKYNENIEDFDYDVNYSRKIRNKVENIEDQYSDALEQYEENQRKKELAEKRKKIEEQRQEAMKKQQAELEKQKKLAEERRKKEMEEKQKEKKRKEGLKKKLEEEAKKRKAEEEAKKQARIREQQKLKEQKEKEAKRKADSLARIREKEKAEELAQLKKAAEERQKKLEERRRKEEEERKEKLEEIEKQARERKKEQELKQQQQKAEKEELKKELREKAEQRRKEEEKKKSLTAEEQKELLDKQKEQAKKDFLEEISTKNRNLLNKPAEKSQKISIPDETKKVDTYKKNGMEITRVIINKEDIIRVYHKVSHYWGGVFYYKNYRNISKEQFRIETDIDKD
jgi:hypothetical protein